MDEKHIGTNIRLLRKGKNMTQAELGRILGYSARTVSDWENGSTEPNIAAIKALVSFFDISYEDLFDFT